MTLTNAGRNLYERRGIGLCTVIQTDFEVTLQKIVREPKRGWIDTFRNEFQLRDTKCYFNTLLNLAQLANIGFAGLFLS